MAGDPEPVFPGTHETWFRQLPPQRQEEFVNAWRARSVHRVELAERMRRRLWIEVAQAAALFAAADVLCPQRSFVTFLALAVCGALGGLAGNRADLAQVTMAALGTAVFFTAELVTRNGLSVMQLFVCFPVGCACAYLGHRRSERSFE